MWQGDRWGFSSRVERNIRDIAHTSLLVFAVTAVAAGILAGISLSSGFGVNASSSFVYVAILFPVLCGALAKELWHARKLETQVKAQEATLGLMGSRLNCGNNTPVGLLILTPDLRVLFANQTYLGNTLQGPEEVLGWKIQDVLPAEGLEECARTVLARSDPAASCCCDTLVRGRLSLERPVHITMTRIAPRHGEDRVLVVVEDLFPGCSLQVGEPVEGYIR
jgi:PAS fold